MGKINNATNLITQRLVLRQWRDQDRKPFAQINADPQVMRYFPSPLDAAASDALLLRNRHNIEVRGWGLWAVERRTDGAFMGFVGLEQPIAALPCAPCVEVGWRLGVAFWGNGYATEAASAALQYGFGELALDEIVSFTTLALTSLPERSCNVWVWSMRMRILIIQICRWAMNCVGTVCIG